MRSAVWSVAILVLASVAGCGLMGNSDARQLKEIITKQLNIPVEKVEITSDTTAVGTTTSGEKLAIVWKKTATEIKCMCQKPKDQAEADVRNLVQQMGYTTKSVSIRSGNGVGYVGEATSDNGISFDVTEDTDTVNLTSMMYVKIAPRSYSQCAKVSLEKELNATVTEEAPIQAGDLPPLNEAGGIDGVANLLRSKKESLFKGRFKANGKWYGVELYQESDKLPVVAVPGQAKTPPSTKMGILYREVW